METFRQGDILFKKVERIPENLVELEDGIIAEGETTGHIHRLQKPGITGTLFTSNKDSSNLYLNVFASSGEIIHNEHASLSLPKGFYQIVRQREYVSPVKEKEVIKSLEQQVQKQSVITRVVHD